VSGVLVDFCSCIDCVLFSVSLDEGIYSYIVNNKIATTYLMGDIPGRTKVASEPSGFGG
jgi:hypothetical protein